MIALQAVHLGTACQIFSGSTNRNNNNNNNNNTPWSRVLLEKLTGFVASQEIPRIYIYIYKHICHIPSTCFGVVNTILREDYLYFCSKPHAIHKVAFLEDGI
jgi:hypothetical protein